VVVEQQQGQHPVYLPLPLDWQQEEQPAYPAYLPLPLDWQQAEHPVYQPLPLDWQQYHPKRLGPSAHLSLREVREVHLGQ
jgi:hypothetical protein